MRINSICTVFLFVFYISCFSILGQNTKTVSSSTYTIQKGEGLYRISVKLGTTMDELLKLNPSLQNGFSEGQVIKVPSLTLKDGSSIAVGSAKNDLNYIFHIVEKGQTLYSISQKYDIPIEVIIFNNAGVENGLIEGAVVKIPKETQAAVNTKKRSDAYIYYTIEPKVTLYGISKQYNCTIDDILEANPGLVAQGLSVGNELRIPRKNPINPSLVNNLAILPELSKDEIYIVVKRDNLAEISKKYSISEDKILRANPLVDFSKLTVGSKILIPNKFVSQPPKLESSVEVSEEQIVADALKSKCGNFNYKTAQTTFKIAILLPFAASENLNASVSDGASQSLSSVSKIFLEYYEGALLALDKLKSEGVKIDCYVYDTWPDSTKISQILLKPELKQMNIIFGPAYAVNLGLVSDFAKQNKIPLVYPLSSKNYELAENPYLFHINSNDTVVYDNVGRFFASQANSKIIAVISQNPSLKERDILAKVKASYDKVKDNAKQSNSFVEIDFIREKEFDKLLSTVSLDKANLIFIPSEKESDVSSIVNSIHGVLKKTTASISIYGMPEWLKYSTISAEDIHASNTFIFARSAMDYYSSSTQSFIKEYRLIYKSEPLAFSPYFQYGGKNPNYSRYGVLGYDLTYYFVSALREFGPQFQQCLLGYRPPLIESNFIFKRLGNWGGFYDDGLFLVHFRPDFKIERIVLH